MVHWHHPGASAQGMKRRGQVAEYELGEGNQDIITNEELLEQSK